MAELCRQSSASSCASRTAQQGCPFFKAYACQTRLLSSREIQVHTCLPPSFSSVQRLLLQGDSQTGVSALNTVFVRKCGQTWTDYLTGRFSFAGSTITTTNAQCVTPNSCLTRGGVSRTARSALLKGRRGMIPYNSNAGCTNSQLSCDSPGCA